MVKKRVTSFDVAKRAGVSRSVVSAVLNGTAGIGMSRETREAVLAAMEELDYHVDVQARGMKTGKSHCLAAFGDTKNPLFLQLLEGMQRACADNGYQVLLYGQGTKSQARSGLINLYQQRRIDGIITLDRTDYLDEEWAAAIEKHGIPYVSVEGYADHSGVTSILADYKDSIKRAMAYLMEAHGETTPVYVELGYNGEDRNWAERGRYAGYMEFCTEQGLTPQVEILAAPEPSSGAWDSFFDQNRTAELVAQYCGQGQPPVFLSNWMAGAVGFYRVAAAQGFAVGKDLFVMSGDNTFRANRYLFPTLSGMEIPYARMGEKAIHELLAQSEKRPEERQAVKHRLLADLVPGESA